VLGLVRSGYLDSNGSGDGLARSSLGFREKPKFDGVVNIIERFAGKLADLFVRRC
jgi:hypothetical protein